MSESDWITPRWAVHERVRSLITKRTGGVSNAPWASLNLGTHVGDDPAHVAQNRARVLAHLPAEPLWLTQVHGTRVVEHGPGIVGAIEADAAVSRAPDQVLAIMTADCLPVLLADGSGEAVGIAHAGWRGLADGVIENTVRAMAVPPERMFAYLGPAIGPQAYEVGEDVRAVFIAHDAAASGAFVARGGGKYHANLYLLARMRLRALGIDRIEGGDRCTLRESADFFSYRRDRVTGRMASFIWME